MFFDSCGIDYQYEPEGFNVGGRYYLPDFYLPEFGVYAEVKPHMATYEENSRHHKMCEEFRNVTGSAILLLEGCPADDTTYALFAWDMCDGSAGSDFIVGDFWDVDGKVVFATDGQNYMVFLDNQFSTESERIKPHGDFGIERGLYLDNAFHGRNFESSDIVTVAALKARQARFEHGESPNAR